MISETSIAYGSSVWRHSRSRRWRAYQPDMRLCSRLIREGGRRIFTDQSPDHSGVTFQNVELKEISRRHPLIRFKNVVSDFPRKRSHLIIEHIERTAVGV